MVELLNQMASQRYCLSTILFCIVSKLKLNSSYSLNGQVQLLSPYSGYTLYSSPIDVTGGGLEQ